MKNKSTSLHLLNRGDTGPFPGSDSCYCARVKQNKRLREKKRSSHAQLTFPECLKVTSTTAAVHPNPPPPSLLGTAQSSCRFHVSDLCCCCFLLWAEFYTVCQSPERHTLEGPVEWDTKSDPSGERLISHLPPPPLSVCLSLSSSLSLPLSLKPFFSSAYPPLFPHPPLLLRLHQQLPRLLAKFEQVRSPLFGEATLHLLARSVLELLAKPSQHPPACITASMQLMNTTEGMCQCPSPAFLFDKFHSQ